MEKRSTAIVTGASTGLGLEIGVRLAKAGYYVLGVARHQPQDHRWADLQKAGSVDFLEADVSNSTSVSEIVSRSIKLGNYNLLINCAGDGVFGPAESYSAQDITNVLSANLVGLIQLCIHSIPAFSSTGGTIVNIMSTAAHVGRANETIYCAAKWGARGFTEALRVELKGKPVRVMAVYPGGMKTPFWEKAKGHNVISDKFMDPGEVADELIFALQKKATLQITDITINRA